MLQQEKIIVKTDVIKNVQRKKETTTTTRGQCGCHKIQQSILQEGNEFKLEKYDKLKADGDDLDDWGTQWVKRGNKWNLGWKTWWPRNPIEKY